MINLDEHKIVIEGKEYVPFDIAIEAVKESGKWVDTNNKLDEALNLLKNSYGQLATALNTSKFSNEE